VSKPQDEIGRELLAHELKIETVVALNANHRPSDFVTSWVKHVAPDRVAFFSGMLNTTLIVRVNERGEMFDDLNHRVRAYQYLGKVEHNVIARTYLRGQVQSEERLQLNEGAMYSLIPRVAKQHSSACAAGTIDMVELEFLDEPDPLERFFRIGTNPDGMVMPIEVDLAKPKPQ
jgi:hypothetical protein